MRENNPSLLHSTQHDPLCLREGKRGDLADNLTPFEYCVLYVDDNPVNLKLVSVVLAKEKHIRLKTALHSKRGIELALKHLPHLIMLDINMPIMNGFQVLEVLKSNEALKDTPIIAVTANAMPIDIERGKASGFDEYITKPININHLLKTINRYLAYQQEGMHEQTTSKSI